MKKSMTVIMTAFFLVFMFGGTSQADFMGRVWPGLDSYANDPGLAFSVDPGLPPLDTPYAEFSVPAINFTAISPSTYNQFLGISTYLYSQGGFAGTNEIDTSSEWNGSFFMFTGQLWLNPTSVFSIVHDDGFALQLWSGSSLMYSIDKSTPVSPTLDTFTPGLTPGNYNIILAYGATNGFPEVLTMNVTNVPEPMTMLLLGFGLFGLAGLRKRD